MSRRDTILGRVRNALDGRAPTEHPGPFEGWRPQAPGGSVIDHFTAMFEAAGGEVRRFVDGAEAGAWVRSFVADFEAISIGHAAPSPLHHGAEEGERIAGVEPAGADVGVSLAFGAVAETGSLIMTPDDGPRAQLLPPVHVVFADERTVFPTLREELDTIRDGGPVAATPDSAWGDGPTPASDAAGPTAFPSAIRFHSGPSKRADKGPELRLGGWFLVRGVWGFLVA